MLQYQFQARFRRSVASKLAVFVYILERLAQLNISSKFWAMCLYFHICMNFRGINLVGLLSDPANIPAPA